MAVALLLSSLGMVIAQPKTKLEAKTLAVFDNYIKEQDKAYKLVLAGEKPFLWVNQQGPDVQKRVSSGEMVIIKEKENLDIHKGIIHIWGVSTFMPGAKAEDVVKLLRDYNHHKDMYASVIDSKLRGSKDDVVTGYLRFVYKKVLTVVLNTEHESKLTKLGDGKYGIQVRSTRIAEVGDYGEKSEKELPVDEGSGFMWRLNTYWVIEQAKDGAFVECSSVTLTRNIPTGFGWLIKPFISGIPRDSLEELVQGTRDGLKK